MRARIISIVLHILVLFVGIFLPFAFNHDGSSVVDHKDPPHIPVYLKPFPSPAPGGGGTRSETPPSKGPLPQFARRQWIPPVPPSPNLNPELVVPPTLLDPNAPLLTNVVLTQYGDPLGTVGPPSGGQGQKGIGNGGRDGIGDGDGAGAHGGPIRGSSISGPTPIFTPDPEFSEEARKARLQGTVVLVIDVDVSGRATNIRVRQSLGLGLDERAIEALHKWRFRPAQQNGKPVVVPATVYVNFRLL
jgi:TonB family protein